MSAPATEYPIELGEAVATGAGALRIEGPLDPIRLFMNLLEHEGHDYDPDSQAARIILPRASSGPIPHKRVRMLRPCCASS